MFDLFYNFIGGEDFDFFNRSKNSDAQHIWAAEALVYETITEDRNSLTYLSYRHFTGGINNVLRYKRTHGKIRAWLHFARGARVPAE